MSDQSRPNLFHYATSELSQDAFICWLAAWADPKFNSPENSALHQAGTDFIRSMMAKKPGSTDLVNIDSLIIKQQVVAQPTDKKRKAKRGRIDILIDVVYTTSIHQSQKAVIIIEDKIDAALTEQLEIYFEAINANEEYLHHEKHFILLKTGYYDTLSNHEEFKQYSRADLLVTLGSNFERSEIVADFVRRLNEIDKQLTAFEAKNFPKEIRLGDDIASEDRFYLTGFHRWLLKDEQQKLKLSGAGYGHVYNLSGGFNGFWWNFQNSPQKDYWSYLQWEDNKLCFKIGFSSSIHSSPDWKVQAEAIKSDWSACLREYNSDISSKGTKVGKTMTVAKIHNGLCQDADGKLDLDQAIAKMVEAQDVLERVRQKIAQSENTGENGQ